MIGKWQLSDLQNQFSGELTKNVAFTGVSTDTRTIKKGDLFIALVGPNFDGHNFVEQAVEKGAVAAVVSRRLDLPVPQWITPDTRIALAQAALANRQRFKGPVYAVTGSSGKTTVKEMLHSILSQNAQVLATKGNLNNDFGVPLTLLSLTDQDEIAVIEQGASARGEIAYTTELSLPDVAILNNAMGAHLEGFGSLQGVVETKAEIYSKLGETDGTAIINLDDEHAGFWLNYVSGQKTLTFSLSDSEADIYATDLNTSANGCYSFRLHRGDESSSVRLSVMGIHNVANALAATAAVSAQGMALSEIAAGLEQFTAVAGRMRPLKSVSGALVIDDSYNANPGSVKAAIDLLVSLPGESILVLGDMAELGDEASEQHEEVGCRAAQKGTSRFMATGALSRHSVDAYAAAAGKHGMHFETKDELIAELKKVACEGVNILIKGSRSAAMDQVVKSLMEGE
ncbi:UDP-N-acetylmuramoyl-tripeptide--D-alanyl-D-alanine ligase [Neptuniibacter sp.]|uniref:UDP-N-acetylmuramoyl-tripeptide--D-alanyl-D- alanine ligase n=1 Tax=Neptuniibacter sp. TaxID=1962643 RepID=UPI00262C27B7|nr:UDP-N-acetylmuramoyl-tripeptide--D-alanyl-D-alanine ligase [Neptuniibacter sp.]MCP4598143.1 UDP-N-acetylmuramoyl-tripeptide--D-alanyl-D-alanine ligase [Neptuniibacter sp.]